VISLVLLFTALTLVQNDIKQRHSCKSQTSVVIYIN